MKRNLTRQADLQLRRFCHRLTVKQRKAVLWILFVPFSAACVYTAYRPFMGSKNRESGMEFMEKDSLRRNGIYGKGFTPYGVHSIYCKKWRKKKSRK